MTLTTNSPAQTILIDSTFNADGEIFPFGQTDTIYGLSVSGSVDLYSDTSLIRVILQDTNGVSWMVYEAYPLITDSNEFSVSNICDESCFLDEFHPNSLSIQIINSTFHLDTIKCSTKKYDNPGDLRHEAKKTADTTKIEKMNQNIQFFDMNWVAGDNSIVTSYYNEKSILFGEKYNLLGYVYYKGGVFEFIGQQNFPKVDPELVWDFDWRNRHGANDSNSFYWDGDTLGSGWLTSAKDQGMNCQSCWAFAAVGVTEALANLYSTRHIDFDLSEQDMVSCSGAGSCSGGSTLGALEYIRDGGVVTEYCFPYDTVDLVCDSPPKCKDPDTIISIYDAIGKHHNYNTYNDDSARIKLITKGPLAFSYPLSKLAHGVVLSGFKFVPGDSTLKWIIKNSWDTTWGDNGFGEIQLEKFLNNYIAVPPLYENGDSIEVECHDYDQDGYYFWGLGPKPDTLGSEAVEDCDDNNPLLGGYDENYNCICLLEYDSIPEHISSNTTWSDTLYIDSDIIIDSGACLTIKSVTYFTTKARIIVDQGGKLTLDGGKLTNACPGTWEGIEAYGSDTCQYFSQYFGTVEIINGGTIENARIGITNYCRLCDHQTLQSGGIIRGDSAIFRNNRIAVDFAPFINEYEGEEQPYRASFDECLFEYTDYLNDYSDFKYFIKMSQVNGVKFLGCDFISDTNAIHPENESRLKYRSGIYSFASQFYVEDVCISQSTPCTEYKPCLFKGLNYGIYAMDYDGRSTASIKKSCFEKNNTGIYLSAINYATVVQDTFDVSKGKYNKRDTLCGLYLDNCTGYQVEENYVHGKTDPNTPLPIFPVKCAGIVVNNSGEHNNEIYNNRFDSLYLGTLALNCNKSENGVNGLQILCNDYTNCYYDISVNAESPGEEDGIARNQGSDGEFPDAPANNTFSYTWNVDESDYENKCNSIIYWHLKDTTTANTKPKYYSIPEVDPQFDNDNFYAYIKDTCCPATFGYGGGGSILENKSLLSESMNRADSIQSLLDIFVDGGNTDHLTTEIQTSTPEEGYQLNELLLTHSPYLSDSAMISSVEKEDVLTPAMVTSILSENPQAAKSDNVQGALDVRNESLTEEQRIEIDQGWFVTGAKEKLEASYSYHSLNRTQAMNNLIRIYKNDTLLVNTIDSIVALYISDNTVFSEYCLSMEYLHCGDTLSAQNVLSNIPQFYSLSDEQVIQHQQQNDITDVIINSGIYKANFDVDSTELAILDSLSISGKGEIKAMARNILLFQGSTTYSEPYVFPDDLTKSEQIKRIPVRREILENSLLIYPNPANDYFIVEYSIKGTITKGYFHLFDLRGRLLKEIPINKTKEFLIISSNNIPSGIYFIQVLLPDSKSISRKLIITR